MGLSRTSFKTISQVSGTKRGVSQPDVTWYLEVLTNRRPTLHRKLFKINYLQLGKYLFLAEKGHILLRSVGTEKRGEANIFHLYFLISYFRSINLKVRKYCFGARQNNACFVVTILLFCSSTISDLNRL